MHANFLTIKNLIVFQNNICTYVLWEYAWPFFTFNHLSLRTTSCFAYFLLSLSFWEHWTLSQFKELNFCQNIHDNINICLKGLIIPLRIGNDFLFQTGYSKHLYFEKCPLRFGSSWNVSADYNKVLFVIVFCLANQILSRKQQAMSIM